MQLLPYQVIVEALELQSDSAELYYNYALALVGQKKYARTVDGIHHYAYSVNQHQVTGIVLCYVCKKNYKAW